MIDPLINHLWQSTLCALAAALLTLAFRKDGAKVRFLIWLAASVKFLIPFSLFVWVGEYFRWETAPGLSGDSGFSIWMGQLAQPATVVTGDFAVTLSEGATSPGGWNLRTIMLSIWILGSLALLGLRLFQWLWLSAIVKTSSPLDIDASIPVRETTSTHEPGIFGIFSPTLLMPAGIASRLAPAQLDAILAHELCHWRRRDNLTAALHMLVEVLFWFHPLVWWLGGRLVVERERACDESVIQSGRDREIYAEGILTVCQHYVELPVCAAGVSGGLLRKRIEGIMTNPILSKLSVAKRCLLSSAALFVIATPIALGLTGGAGVALAATTNSVELRHYRNEEWKFELDIPKGWIVEPPVPSNGPEVIRFHSPKPGPDGLIVWRSTNYPNHTPQSYSLEVQRVLAKGGFSNFVSGETSIGSRRVQTLDFEQIQPDGSLMSCRHYFVIDGGVRYVLGFGTSNRAAMFDTFDRVAKSFAFEEL
jgi:beta-lactamase regulating signal transducer with metallopeptidase domain